MDKTMAFGIGSVVGLLICSMLLKDHRYFELIATWLIEASQQLIPTLNALLYLIAGAMIHKWGAGQ